MIVLIDNGHGRETPGKRSPDGRLPEWHYTRRVAAEVVRRLTARGIDDRLLVPEDRDVALAERCRRANAVGGNALLVSIHCNASGMGREWLSASGWSVFCAPGASQASIRLAAALHDAAAEAGLKIRRPAPGVKHWTQSLAICRATRCPAVLTENLFQDCRTDVDFLLSPEGFETIVSLHVNGITRYINSL